MNRLNEGLRAFHDIAPGCIIKTDISLYRGARCIVVPADTLHMLYVLSVEPQGDDGVDKLVALHPLFGLVSNFVSSADYRSRTFRLGATCGSTAICGLATY